MSNPHLRIIRNDEELKVADLTGGVGDWRERALCREVDGELFYPDKGESNREAKRVCGRCEVKTECLEYALGADERWGVWGGLSERERRAMLKRRAA
ncbi:WhiB family transcriptional regulator [Micromonospora chokoriensis]